MNTPAVLFSNVLLPGQSLPIPCRGTFFEVRACSLPFNIRTNTGVYDIYGRGQGLAVAEGFNALEVQNPNAIAIAFQVKAGDDRLIDRTIYQAQEEFQVMYPTQPTTGASTILIPDRTGDLVTDIDGNTWYAVRRQFVLISNTATGSSATIINLGAGGSSPTAQDKTINILQPTTTHRIDSGGSFKILSSGGAADCIVSECYSVIPRY